MAEEKSAQHDPDRPDASVDTATGPDIEAAASSHAPDALRDHAAPDRDGNADTTAQANEPSIADAAEAPTGSAGDGLDSDADLDATFTRAQEAINRLSQTADTQDDDAPEDGAPDGDAEPAADAADAEDGNEDSDPGDEGDATDAPVDGHNETEASSPTDTAAPASPKPSPDPASLAELDESIAEEADALLDGDFESVEEVLDDVFAHHANEFNPGRQAPSDERGPAADESDVAKRSDGGTTGAADDAPGERRDAGKKAELAAMADDRNTGGMPGGKPDLRKISMPPEPDEAIVQKSPAASAPGGETIKSPAPPEPTAPDEPADETEEFDADDDPLEVTVHAPSSSMDDEPDADPEPEAAEAPTAARAAESEDAGTTTKRTWRDWLQRALSAIEAALRIVNWPLHWLPSSVRHVVDWVALTLVFWIPIIWVIALFVVG